MKIFKLITVFIAYFIAGMMEISVCYMFPTYNTMSFIAVLSLLTLIGFMCTFYNILEMT